MQVFDSEQLYKSVKNEFEKAKALAEAWNKVSIEKKKDGMEYRNVAQGVKNANVRRRTYCSDPKDMEIYVFIQRPELGYISDSIYIKDYAHDRVKTTEELRAEIRKKVNDLADRARDLQMDLALYSCACDTFRKEYKAAVQHLENSIRSTDVREGIKALVERNYI